MPAPLPVQLRSLLVAKLPQHLLGVVPRVLSAGDVAQALQQEAAALTVEFVEPGLVLHAKGPGGKDLAIHPRQAAVPRFVAQDVDQQIPAGLRLANRSQSRHALLANLGATSIVVVVNVPMEAFVVRRISASMSPAVTGRAAFCESVGAGGQRARACLPPRDPNSRSIIVRISGSPLAA